MRELSILDRSFVFGGYVAPPPVEINGTIYGGDASISVFLLDAGFTVFTFVGAVIVLTLQLALCTLKREVLTLA